jgi:hypothetical protein
MPKDAPNFALLIGKPKKKDGMSEEDPSMEAADKEVSHEEDLGMDKESVESSAMKDFISSTKAGDAMGAKEALKDFLAACYPELGGEEEQSEEY